MMIRNFFILIIGLLLLVPGTSCAPKKPPIERSHFILEPAKFPREKPPSVPAVLSIRNFKVSPGYQGRELIYKKECGRSSRDFHNHYFISPGPMLTQAVRDWLEDYGPFDAVIPLSSHRQPDYILEGAVVSMFGDFQNPDQPKAVMRIQFLLLGAEGLDYDMIMHGTYHEEVLMDRPGAAPMISALNDCLSRILVRLEKDLVESIGERLQN